ncbi:uncharacterized protein LOC143360612 [Halictus rubicundus]|uniref:uncharacterized protein LOC143360612 n=1 Tax=Halictus rubicundus TaxID=77578 RepID=UPI004035B3C6
MDKELQTQHVNNRILTGCCSDGVERNIDSTTLFKLPPELLKRRKQFWDDLFTRYTEESLMENETDLNDFYASGPYKKSFKFIQYWVDNGTLPYKTIQDIDEQSEEYHAKELSESSSSSSVDTAAYILSNMNTTNKVDTIAIVEGSKRSTLLNVENEDLENMETIELNTDKMCRTRCGDTNSVQHNDKSNSSMTSLMFERSVGPKEDITQVPKHLHAHTNDITASNSTEHLSCNKLFINTLMNLTSKTAQNNSLLSQTNMVEDNSMSPNNSMKLSQRKKLYSGRDSPVDIVFTNRRSKHIIRKSKQYLHPALNTEYKIRRGSKFLSKRRARTMSMFQKSMMSNSMLNLTCKKNTRKRKSSSKNSSKSSLPNVNGLKNQKTKSSSIETNNTVIKQNNHDMGSSLIISNGSKFGDSVKDANEFKIPDSTVRIFKKPKLVDPSSHVSRSDLLEHKKSDKATTLQNSNPVVCLKKLSEDDIQKYKKPKSSIYNSDNLLNPVVHLNRLSKSDIEKYKKADTVVKNVKNSASVIPEEDRKVEETMTIPCQLSPTVRLTRLSKKRVNKSAMSDVNPSELKENNLLSQTTQIQNNDASTTKKTSHSQDTSNSLLPNKNTINLYEDSDSNQSTLLIYECNSPYSKKLTRNLRSASNVNLKNKLETTINKILKNNTMVLLNNATDKHHDNCIRQTRNSQRNKGNKPNNGNGGGLSFSKSNKTNNNIDPIQIVNDMSDVSVYSYKHNNRLHSDEVEIVYKNNCKQASKPKHNKNHNFLILPDDSDEFIKLIPKRRHKSLKNSLDTDTSDTDASCNVVTHVLRSQRSPTFSESSVQSTVRDWNFRNPRNKVVLQKQKNVNVGKIEKRPDINYLRFQTRFDTDSEASSC